MRRRGVFWLIPAAVLPAASQGQQLAPARIGIAEFGNPPDSGAARIFMQGLSDAGYRETINLRVERRYASGRAERYPELLRDLAGQKPQLVFVVGHDIAKVAKTAIPDIAVVTAGSEDPVASGLIRSFNRPGGNITGVSYISPELAPKRLELLKQAVPGLERLGVLWEPAHADTYYQNLRSVAGQFGMDVQLAEIEKSGDLDAALSALRDARVQALFVVPSRLTGYAQPRIVEFAAAARLPSMSAYRSFAEAGGLMSYGASTRESLLRASAQGLRILGGANPADIPFELPRRFEFVLNQKVAHVLGVVLPQAMLLRADEVIR